MPVRGVAGDELGMTGQHGHLGFRDNVSWKAGGRVLVIEAVVSVTGQGG